MVEVDTAVEGTATEGQHLVMVDMDHRQVVSDLQSIADLITS
jgi:hypothetical protein